MLSACVDQWRSQFFDQIDALRAFEPVFDRLPDVVFSVKDLAGRYVSISEACVDRCHLRSRQQAIGKTAFDLFPAHMAERYAQQDRHVFSTGQSISDSLDLTLHGDGSHGWCLSHKQPLKNKAGDIVGLTCVSRDVIEPSREGVIDIRFADTIDHVRQHYAQALRVEDLAERAGLSVAQFERRVKKVFQVLPGQFILKTRIDAAAAMLLGTSQSIAHIALTVGFCDQSALSRQFRQVTGMSPSQFRQKKRTDV